MAADPTLVKGAYIANAPRVGQWNAVLDGLKDLSKVFETARSANLELQLAEIKAQGDRRVKGDDWTMRISDHYGKNVNGPLGNQLSIATNDVTFEKDIFVSAEGDAAYQANITNFNNQAAADSATMSSLLGLYDKSVNNEGEGAPISNSATGWDVDYLTERKLAAQYTFKLPNGQAVTKTRGIDDDWFTQNNQAIVSGEIKMTAKHYGLLKTTLNNNVPGVQWVGADQVQRDIERTKVDINSRGAIADLGANSLLAGKEYLSSDPGRMAGGTGKGTNYIAPYIAREDKRQDFNESETRQVIDAIIHTDIKDYEVRSIVSDVMIGGDKSLIGEWDSETQTFSKGHLDALLEGQAGMKFEEDLEKALGFTGEDANGEIDTAAELAALKMAMWKYGQEGQAAPIKNGIKDVIKDYLFLYAKNQFIIGAAGSYKSDLGIGEVLAEDAEGEPLFEFID